MSVLSIRLVTGEDVVAEVEDTGISFLLKNPVQVSLVPNRSGSQPTFGFMPFPITSNDKEVTIRKEHVVFTCAPAEEFLNQYNSLFGTGIITPPKQLIV